jgi:hypothetical protein
MTINLKNILMASTLLLTLYATQTPLSAEDEPLPQDKSQHQLGELKTQYNCYWATIADGKGKCASAPALCAKLKFAQWSYKKAAYLKDIAAIEKSYTDKLQKAYKAYELDEEKAAETKKAKLDQKEKITREEMGAIRAEEIAAMQKAKETHLDPVRKEVKEKIAKLLAKLQPLQQAYENLNKTTACPEK